MSRALLPGNGSPELGVCVCNPWYVRYIQNDETTTPAPCCCRHVLKDDTA